jgi:hypothetical protein
MVKPGLEHSLAPETKLVITMLYFLQKKGVGTRRAEVMATAGPKSMVGLNFPKATFLGLERDNRLISVISYRVA